MNFPIDGECCLFSVKRKDDARCEKGLCAAQGEVFVFLFHLFLRCQSRQMLSERAAFVHCREL